MDDVVLDTNVLVSALIFGGLPRELLDVVLTGRMEAVTSPVLIEELLGILRIKFRLTSLELVAAQQTVQDTFTVVTPRTPISVLADESDNRVLEAAIEGMCDMIVTGDKAFLALGSYKGITIMSVREFLESMTKG